MDDQELAADLKHRGQREPIHVMPPDNKAGLPAYCILDGHRRVSLMRRNGQTEMDVIILHDLARATAQAVETEFLKFNLHRRQLHPLDQAAMLLRLASVLVYEAIGKWRMTQNIDENVLLTQAQMRSWGIDIAKIDYRLRFHRAQVTGKKKNPHAGGVITAYTALKEKL